MDVAGTDLSNTQDFDRAREEAARCDTEWGACLLHEAAYEDDADAAGEAGTHEGEAVALQEAGD